MDTEPQVLATARNVSFGYEPKYFDMEPPHSLVGLVESVLRARCHTLSMAAARVAKPSCDMTERLLLESQTEELEQEWAVRGWFKSQGRRWNRYKVIGHWVFLTKGDETGRFYAVICDHAGRVPCCGCGGYGLRVDRDVRGPAGRLPGLPLVKTCPICEGRGNILVAPVVAKLKEVVS